MGQYRLNLGIVTRREGDRAGAQQHFLMASRLSPTDGETLRMATAVQPATPEFAFSSIGDGCLAD